MENDIVFNILGLLNMPKYNIDQFLFAVNKYANTFSLRNILSDQIYSFDNLSLDISPTSTDFKSFLELNKYINLNDSALSFRLAYKKFA